MKINIAPWLVLKFKSPKFKFKRMGGRVDGSTAWFKISRLNFINQMFDGNINFSDCSVLR